MVQAQQQTGKRVGIALPIPLYEKLCGVRLERGLSAVCLEALERAVEVAEAKQQVTLKRTSLVTRLRAERRQFSSEDFQAGRARGFTETNELEYRDFRQLEKLWHQRDELILRDGSWLQLSTLTSYWDDENKIASLGERVQSLEEGEEIVLVERYLAGWLEGIMEVWHDIAEEVER